MPPTSGNARPGLRRRAHGAAVGAVLAVAVTAATSAAASPAASPADASSAAGQVPAQVMAGGLPGPGGLGAQLACAPPAPRHAACMAIVDSSLHWNGTTWNTGAAPAARPRTAPPAATPPSAPLAPYMAADLQAAYRLPSALLGARQTIAIVDAYDDPSAAADLAVYRAANHLPACDASFPCFEKVNQDGQQGSYPPADPSGTGGWELEASLDVDMASAICPNCKIILVEANDNSDASLAAAEDQAVKLGATVISNSWGEGEFNGETTALGPHFQHPGVVITASSGDSGFGVIVPAALPGVIAVGGTALYPDASGRGWAETAWMFAGAGCSAYIAKPPWQHDKLCGKRAVADVSAVADPATPVAVYDSFGNPGWTALGGTSVGSPIIAGVYALAGNTAAITPGAWLYAHRSSLFDPASGSDGYCGGSYLCTAGTGYDGPTGNGTPDGIGGF